MAKSRFKISEFTNPSGKKAWRLSGTLNGKRIRENYQSRSEAVARRQHYDVEALNGQSDGQTVWTTLTHEQNRDAIAAVNLLKSAASASSLSFAVSFFLQNYRAPEAEMSAEVAATEYLEKRRRDYERSFITVRQFQAIRSEMNWLKLCFGGAPVSSITPDAFRDYLEKPKNQPTNRRKVPEVSSLKTWNNRRGLVNTFCDFCVEKRYLSENPIARVPQHKIRRSRATAETLTAEKAKELLHFLEAYTGPDYKRQSCRNEPGFLVPFVTIALFAGVRPDWQNGEIGKLRVQDIDLKTGVIRIEPKVSKVNEKRVIKIQPNLRNWLEKYPLDRFPLVPKRNPDRILRDLRTKMNLGHDVLRHTFISMTVGAFRSVGDASLQAGNSEAVIRKHYLDLKSVEEADEFWRIVPNGTTLPGMEKKDGRYVMK